MSTELSVIAQHPVVYFNIRHDTARWAFARYYLAVQAKSESLLILLDMIDHWRCAPIHEIVQEMTEAA